MKKRKEKKMAELENEAKDELWEERDKTVRNELKRRQKQIYGKLNEIKEMKKKLKLLQEKYDELKKKNTTDLYYDLTKPRRTCLSVDGDINLTGRIYQV